MRACHKNRSLCPRSVYLRTYLAGRDRLPSFLQADWLAAGLWHCLGRADLATRSYTFLESRVPEMSASNLAALVIALRGAGVAPSHALLAAAGARLTGLQAEDGHWPGEDSPSRDVAATLDALYALKLSGLL